MLNSSIQHHLNHNQTVNLGSYYTNQNYVDVVWSMLQKHLTSDTIIVDSSCGYGNFFDSKHRSPNSSIGLDIDPQAVAIATNKFPQVDFRTQNALENISRESFGIDDNKPLVIIGNPPYNDTTSIIRSDLKKIDFKIDSNVQTRDLGMSFMLSYNELKADYVCILHPLSYLIKKSNFGLLKNFAKNYSLIDSLMISSATFEGTSKTTQFPILIGLYKRGNPMTYQDIWDYNFNLNDSSDSLNLGHTTFRLSQFDYLNNYIDKYPSKFQTPDSDSILFYTMRDINALKRSRTFIDKPQNNAIIVNKNKLELYIYAGVIKEFSHHIPYYMGNCDIPIDLELFQEYKSYFVVKLAQKHNFLNNHYKIKPPDNLELVNSKIQQYLQQLLKNHYVY